MKKALLLSATFLVSLVVITAGHVPDARAAPFVVDFSFPNPVTQGSPVIFNSIVSGNTGSLQYSWYLEDGTYLGSGSVASYTFPSSGSHTLALRVYDSGSGATAYASHSVNIQHTPVRVSLSSTASRFFGLSGTVGSPTSFSASVTSGRPPYTFSWDFGDGGTGTGVVATHTYSVAGVFIIVLKVTDIDGFVAVASGAFSISATPVLVDFSVPAPVIQNVPATFTSSVSGNIGGLQYSWYLDDGTYLGGSSAVSYTFTGSGNRTLVLGVYDSGGNPFAVASHSANVQATPLAADFSFPTPVTQGSPVTFTATGLHGVSSSSISWAFGDAGTATGNPATHAYSTAGLFNVVLMVTYANGTAANVQHSVNVVSTRLRVEFSFASGSTQNSPVTFTATTSNGVPPFSYTWYFGDGSYDSNNLNPISHTYSVAGNYTVTLVVYDSNPGGRVLGVVSHAVAVGLLARSLEADFSAAAAPATKDNPVTFVATATFGTPPYSFDWSFGDGGAGLGVRSTHSYSSAGLFNVVLRVTDGNGEVATVNHPVSVLSTSIRVDFSYASPVTQGGPVVFAPSVSGNSGSLYFVWRLGDGNYFGYGYGASNVSAAGYTFSSPGNYTVSLFVTDLSVSASAFASHSVIVKPSPMTVGFTLPSAGPTIGSPSTWTATVVGGNPPYSISWDFGDGNTGSGLQATHTYSSVGRFLVVLKVTDSAGAGAVASSLTQPLSSSLLLDFSFPTPVTQGSPVTFSPTFSGATGSLLAYWTLSDGTNLGYFDGVANVAPVSYTFNVPGTYTVTLYVLDHSGGASVYASHGVSVRPSFPTTDFSFPTPVTQGSPVAFTATGVAGASSIDWSFGDGGTGTGIYATHTYSSAGTFTAVLTVHQANGGVTTASHSVSVQSSSVLADFSFPTSSQGSPITFNATASGGVAPYRFYWYFGDGTSDTSNVNPVSHTYAAPGNYTLTLNVYDSNSSGNAFAGASHRVNVALPKASLEVDFTGYGGFTVGSPDALTATAAFGTPPYTFSWSFGDGTKATGTRVAHTYASAGAFIVVVNATDTDGTVVTASRAVVVNATPVLADFAFPAASQGSPVTFTGTASGGVSPYQLYWGFGDGASDSSNTNPITHVYTVPGAYLVTLLVYDSNSTIQHYAYATHYVTVSLPKGSLKADFGGFSGYTQGSPVTLSATASFGTAPYSFSWDFGDLSSGTGNPVTHAFATAGLFIVVLRVTDATGAVATASHAGVIVSTPVRADFSSSSNPTQGSPVTLTAVVSGGVSPYQLYWGFGDGASDSSNTNPITHVYTVPGAYLATLLAYDSNSTIRQYAYATHVVNVSPSAGIAADFSFPIDTSVSVGSPGTWTATVLGGTPPYSFAWAFGDGSTGTGSQTAHTYSSSGSFNITLKVTDSHGTVGTISHLATVLPSSLLVDFSFASPVTQGSSVVFVSSVSGSPGSLSFVWRLGDSTYFGGSSIAGYTFSSPGNYTVSLFVADGSSSASAFASHSVTVKASPLTTIAIFPSGAGLTVGSPGTWTGTASGGSPPYSFSRQWMDRSSARNHSTHRLLLYDSRYPRQSCGVCSQCLWEPAESLLLFLGSGGWYYHHLRLWCE